MSAYSDLISGARGTYVVNNGTEFTKPAMAYYVAEDTISVIKVAGVDVTSSYVAATGTALKAGVFLVPRADLGHTLFSAVDVTSGSVVALLA